MKRTEKVPQGTPVPGDWKYLNTVTEKVLVKTIRRWVDSGSAFNPLDWIFGRESLIETPVYEEKLFDIYEEWPPEGSPE